MKYEYNTIRSAVEFGFKGHEKGYNLQKVLSDFDTLMKPTKEGEGNGKKI